MLRDKLLSGKPVIWIGIGAMTNLAAFMIWCEEKCDIMNMPFYIYQQGSCQKSGKKHGSTNIFLDSKAAYYVNKRFNDEVKDDGISASSRAKLYWVSSVFTGKMGWLSEHDIGGFGLNKWIQKQVADSSGEEVMKYRFHGDTFHRPLVDMTSLVYANPGGVKKEAELKFGINGYMNQQDGGSYSYDKH